MRQSGQTAKNRASVNHTAMARRMRSIANNRSKTPAATLTDEAKGAAGWENSKGQQPQEGTGSAHSLVIAMGIHVGGIKPNSIFDGCDLDLEGSPL